MDEATSTSWYYADSVHAWTVYSFFDAKINYWVLKLCGMRACVRACENTHARMYTTYSRTHPHTHTHMHPQMHAPTTQPVLACVRVCVCVCLCVHASTHSLTSHCPPVGISVWYNKEVYAWYCCTWHCLLPMAVPWPACLPLPCLVFSINLMLI